MNERRQERQRALIETARAMNAERLNRGTAGNVSLRDGDGFLVTPTGMAYDQCQPEDIPYVGLDGQVQGRRKPSSEWRFHRDIYAAHADAGAIIHAHAPFASTLACMGSGIPQFHYMVARFGGKDVRCAEYATFGTQALSDAILKALDGRRGCLMAHHGLAVFGADLEEALALAIELEGLSEQYWRVLQIGGPQLLSDDEMARVLLAFQNYGRQ